MIALLLNKYVLGGVLVAALLAGCAFAYWHHGNVRYTAGIAAQQAADATAFDALQVAIAKVDADRAAKVAKANQETVDAQKRYDDYVRRFPLGPIRVRIDPHYREISVPKTVVRIPSGQGAAAGPEAGGPVHPGDASVDLSPAIRLVLHGFADLDNGFRECRERALIEASK